MNRITHIGVEGAITVAINTDKQHLDHTRAQQKLLVGRHITRGLGAGGDPVTGRRCAEAGRDVITRIVSGADLVFVTAGLGGMGGAQPLAITMNEGVALIAEMEEWRVKKRLETRYLDKMSTDIDEGIDMALDAKKEGRGYIHRSSM